MGNPRIRPSPSDGDCRFFEEGGWGCNCTTGVGVRAGGGEVAPTCLEQRMQFCPEAFE